MGRLAPMGLLSDPGLSLSCALGDPAACRTCSRPLTCTCTCHRKEAAR